MILVFSYATEGYVRVELYGLWKDMSDGWILRSNFVLHGIAIGISKLVNSEL